MLASSRHQQWLAAASFLLHGASLTAGQGLPVTDEWLRTWAAGRLIDGIDFSVPLGPSDIRIIYCSEILGNTCGGSCSGYQGPGSICLNTTFSASCLAATQDINFCNREDCDTCRHYNLCASRMPRDDGGFCETADTNTLELFAYGPIQPSASTESELAGSTAQNPSTSESSPPTTVSISPPASTSSPDSISSPPSTSPQREGAMVLPVGAIVGAALGSLALVLAALLLWYWLRTKRKRAVTPSGSDTQVQPFVRQDPLVSGAHPNVQYITKSPADTTASHSSSNASSSGSSSGRSAKTPRRHRSRAPSHLEIVHEDSGIRVTPSVYGRAPVVEHPPPYSMS